MAWNSSDLLIIDDVDYFSQLGEIVERTARRTLANYLTIAAAITLRPFVLNNLSVVSWRDCVEQMKPLQAVAKLYAERLSTKIKLDEVRTFVDSIVAVSGERVCRFDPVFIRW